MEKNTASVSVITNYLVSIIPELMRHEMKLHFAFPWQAHRPVCLEDAEIPSECGTVRYIIITIK